MTDATKPAAPESDERATSDLLGQRLQALAAAWEAGSPPADLGALAPDRPDWLRELVLAELVKADLEFRRRAGRPLPSIEDYLRQLPDLARNGVPVALVYEEYLVRKRAGDVVTPREYHRRFPELAEALERLFDAPETVASTCVLDHQVGDPVQAGETIDDFDLLLLLGKGGFARVFLARQRSLQRLVALKISADRGDEPRALAQLDHPHIVHVFDQRTVDAPAYPGRSPGPSRLRLLYMQYAPGGTLQSVIDHARSVAPPNRSGKTLLEAIDVALARRGTQPPYESALRRRLAAMGWGEVVCWMGARLAEALAYAHAKGVLHRDVKPANVLLTAEGAPLLADFNVGYSSKLAGVSPATFFGGSLAYMPPEQIEAFDPGHPRRAEEVDGRADLYSLGVTLWELLVGDRPFPDDVPPGLRVLDELAARRRTGLSVDSSTRLPAGTPRGLFGVLRVCLAPQPEQRYATADELARQLELCRRPRTRDLLHPPARSWRRWTRRHPVAVLFALALVPNLLAAGLNIVYNQAAIVDHLSPAAAKMFQVLIWWVNGIAFPFGLFLYGLAAWPTARAAQRREAGLDVPPEELTRARRRCLRLAPITFLICVGLWVVAGAAFPVLLDQLAQPLEPSHFLHFIASQTLCGLIAVSYPFFGVTFVAVRALYPALLPAGAAGADEAAELDRVGRSVSPFLALAAAVPLFAVGLLALFRSDNVFALGVISLAGLAGLGATFALARRIQADLAALRAAVAPEESAA